MNGLNDEEMNVVGGSHPPVIASAHDKSLRNFSVKSVQKLCFIHSQMANGDDRKG